MRFLRCLITLLALFSLIGATSALADSSGGNTVVFTNNTSYTVDEFYSSNSDAASWNTASSNNLLAGQSVQPGQSVTINIPVSGGYDGDGGGGCSYDLMAVAYGSAQFAYQYGVNVCGGGSWTLTP